jgi:hypothetical protein
VLARIVVCAAARTPLVHIVDSRTGMVYYVDMHATIIFEPVIGKDWVCDFGMDDTGLCPNPFAWVTNSTEWVVPMFACDECKRSYDF